MTQPYGIVFADRRPASRCHTATTANIFVQTKYGNFPSAQMSKQIWQEFFEHDINFAPERADVRKDYVYALVVFESYSSNHFLSSKVIFHLKKATELYKRPGYRVSYKHQFLLNATVWPFLGKWSRWADHGITQKRKHRWAHLKNRIEICCSVKIKIISNVS